MPPGLFFRIVTGCRLLPDLAQRSRCAAEIRARALADMNRFISAASDTKPSGRSSLVTMVQAANFGEREDPVDIRAMDRPWLRGVFVQSEMRSAPVIVVRETTEVVAKPAFTAHDHVVQAFTTDRADHAFDVGALPGRAGRR